MHSVGDLLGAAMSARRTMKFTWLDDRPLAAGTAMGYAAQVGVRLVALGLADYEDDLTTIAREQGYVQRDEVSLTPDTPDLATIEATFAEEHKHTEDEVRFVTEGEGLFDVRSREGFWIRIAVTPGDLLVLPAGLFHRFRLTDAKTIRAIRLFKDKAGWTPIYRSG
jgi:1,2-dihydroxy-3-keto-5-methylthiopentene dioxygenase